MPRYAQICPVCSRHWKKPRCVKGLANLAFRQGTLRLSFDSHLTPIRCLDGASTDPMNWNADTESERTQQRLLTAKKTGHGLGMPRSPHEKHADTPLPLHRMRGACWLTALARSPSFPHLAYIHVRCRFLCFCFVCSSFAGCNSSETFAGFHGLPNSAQQRQRDLSVTALWRHLEKSHAKNLLEHLKAGYRG